MKSCTWQAHRLDHENGCAQTISFTDHGTLLRLEEVLAGWCTDERFREFIIAELAATPYSAFFWELPQVTQKALSLPFECAVTESDELTHITANDSDFASHLNASSEPVVAFRNLGHDALLVAPRRVSDANCYGHIAAFLREAPHEQQHALFQRIAKETMRLIGSGHRFWISTSGLGVPWLHVRLDTDPKYYQYRPYAEPRD